MVKEVGDQEEGEGTHRRRSSNPFQIRSAEIVLGVIHTGGATPELRLLYAPCQKRQQGVG